MADHSADCYEAALRRLPDAHSLALRLRDADVADEVICQYLHIEGEGLETLLLLADNKLAAELNRGLTPDECAMPLSTPAGTKANAVQFEASLLQPNTFTYGAVSSLSSTPPATLGRCKPPGLKVAPPLGPLGQFTGTFTGNGFNTIFRPQNSATPTPLPIPVGGDNVLELNLTSETLSFSTSLGAVPDRGMVHGDVFLNGVPYLQTVTDVTDPNQPVGIHFEPGVWMIVPAATGPTAWPTLARMASIPHGTTFVAQGTSTTLDGAPTIPPVGITPTLNATGPPQPVRLPSQTATNDNTARIPQDLTRFVAAGTITQDLLDDPNTFLRNRLASQHVASTTTISISTDLARPLFGGGVNNIAFLLGDVATLNDPQLPGPNAQTLGMRATFWIETVESTIVVPPFMGGQPPLIIAPEPQAPGEPTPRFQVFPPVAITQPRPITVRSTQIQYSQEVFLNFNGLTWPHVSVATLVPNEPVAVPSSSWPSAGA